MLRQKEPSPSLAKEFPFAKPHGAPRGLLIHYILYMISLKPSHGYELLQDIEERTEGAWRPGPGSIYPMLKKLVSHGYIKAESQKRMETAQMVYHITPKGEKMVQEAKQNFAEMGQKWSALRRIFIEMLDPKGLEKFFVDGTKLQFDIARETLESKLQLISPSEAGFILKEYALNLQRQLDWSNDLLEKLKRTQSIAGSSNVMR